MSRSRKNRRRKSKNTTTKTTTTTKTVVKQMTTIADKVQHKMDLRQQVEDHFNRDMLGMICEMREQDFGDVFGLEKVVVDDKKWLGDENYYFFKDNGSDILAVAHLDTVVHSSERGARFVETAEEGWVIHSGALDDRLGAFIILFLLPALGLKFDILLTVGEESGSSTASYFETQKDYNWLIEFDRGGTDVVMYEYQDSYISNLVRACGARVGSGSFSDISYMEHVGAKGFNWGVGYQDYHSTRGYAFLNDTMAMVTHFLIFHEANATTQMKHTARPRRYGGYGGYSGGWWGDDGDYREKWNAQTGEWEPDTKKWSDGLHGFHEKDGVEVETDEFGDPIDEGRIDDEEYVEQMTRLWPTEDVYAEGPTDEELEELGLEEIEGDESVASYTIIKSATEVIESEGGDEPQFPALDPNEKFAKHR